MDVRERAAAIATALNILLTILKFVLFGLTGSLAVLAEAWHSLSDIATSALTYLAVRRTGRQPRLGGSEPIGQAALINPSHVSVADERLSEVRRIRLGPWTLPTAEQAASLAIGVVILGGALNILARVVWYDSLPIGRPLLAGALFLLFAVGSHLVYQIEVDVGNKTGSPGLVVDGLHSRADMIASLLTGLSLVLYHMGLDLDRFIAALIGLLVLSIALEAGTTALLGIRRGKGTAPPRYQSHEILRKALSGEGFKRAAGRFLGPGVLPVEVAEGFRRIKRWGTAAFVIGLLVLWGRTCLFSVGLTQEAVVEHLGRPTRRAVPPGLHLKWPWPIDRVVLVDKTVFVAGRIGNESDPQAFALIWTREHGTEIPFLSGDNNFFFPYLVVQWRVKDSFDLTYRQKEPKELLDAICHRVVSELCAARGFYELASTHRQKLAEDTRVEAQTRLDDLHSGIEIVSVNLSDIHPPVFIADSFEEVVVARFQEQQRAINQAMGYKNERLPHAVGQAALAKARASAERAEHVGRADGRAGAFLLRSKGLSAARKIIMERMYFDWLVDCLRGAKKIVIEAGLGRPDLWLGLDGTQDTSLPPAQAEKLKKLREQME